MGAGQGLAYSFSVPETGKYRIRAIGVGRTYSMRLEDGEGWPVITPGVPADRQLKLAAGSYRLIIDPEAVEPQEVIRSVRWRLLLPRRSTGKVLLNDGHFFERGWAGQIEYFGSVIRRIQRSWLTSRVL